MTTAQLEEKIYSAFVEDENLVGFLPNGTKSIFHIRTPSVKPDYPILVYSVLSDVPSLHGDNEENFHRVTMRIHIITGDGDYPQIYAKVKRIMTDLGFVRLQSTPFLDEDGTFMLVTDWKIILDDN